MEAFFKFLGGLGSGIAAIAGLPAAFTGITKVIVIIAGIISGLLWLRHDITSTATTAANVKCEQRIAAIEKTQTTEADNRAETADDAAEAVARAHARADLERVCKGDPACRDGQN
ncbi:MAG: hypothetical protein ACK4MF_08060 [Hyphomicrobiaceae bacterium]